MKNIKKNSILLLIITLLILFLVLKDDFNDIINVLLNVDIKYIIFSIIAMFVYLIFRSLSKFSIVREYSKSLKFITIFKQTLITQFLNGITPFSTGGQPMEIYMLKKSNLSLAKSTNVVLLTSLVYQIALVLYGVFAIVMNYKYSFFDSIPFVRKLVVLGFSINTIVCIAICVICFSNKTSTFIANICIKIGKKLKIIKDDSDFVERMNNKIYDFQQSGKLFITNKKLFIKMFIYEVIALTIFYSIPLFLIKGLKIESSIGLLTVLTSSAYVLLIGSFVPIPGGSGGIEFGFIKFFGTFISNSNLSALLLIWRFVTYYLGIVIGGIAFSFYKGDE